MKLLTITAKSGDWLLNPVGIACVYSHNNQTYIRLIGQATDDYDRCADATVDEIKAMVETWEP